MNIDKLKRNLRIQWQERRKLQRQNWELTTPNGKTAPKKTLKEAMNGIITHWVRMLREEKGN